MASGSVPNASPGRTREALDIGPILGGKRRADEARARPAANDDAGRSGIGATQLQLVGVVQHGAETERPREGFRADQVGFLEFQPR